jgi:hypothetical protein
VDEKRRSGSAGGDDGRRRLNGRRAVGEKRVAVAVGRGAVAVEAAKKGLRAPSTTRRKSQK